MITQKTISFTKKYKFAIYKVAFVNIFNPIRKQRKQNLQYKTNHLLQIILMTHIYLLVLKISQTIYVSFSKKQKIHIFKNNNYLGIFKVKENINEFENQQIMEKHQRNDARLLSSLRDLRLNSNNAVILTQERKRQHKRLGPIKVRNDQGIIYQNFKIVDKRKTQADVNFISKSLSEHFTFSSLITNKNMHDQLVDQFRLCKVEDKQYLIKQNDSASSFFILKQGELIVQINGQEKGVIKNGAGFGQLALLYSTPRAASIWAKKTSYLWLIDRVTFRSVVTTIIQKTLTENKKFISSNKFFIYLTDKQKEKLASVAISQKFEKNTVICTQGALACAMYIIKSGKLKRSVDGSCVGYWISGDSLEEYAVLSKNSTRKETIIAEQSTQLLAFGAEDIQKVLGRSLPIIILRNNAKKIFREDKFLKQLSKQYMEKIIDCFKIKKINAEQFAFSEGDFCKNKILFVIEGDYELTKKFQSSSLYGSECIGIKERMATYNFGCKFITQGKIAETTIQEVQLHIGCTVDQAIQKSNSLRATMQIRQSGLLDLKNYFKNFQLRDFSVLKKLGQGQFGQVFLVVCNKNNNLYALKCISKAQTLKYKLEKHLICEKQVLENHCSPFTLDFIRSFNDQNYIYFLTEFIDGLEMFDALRIIGLVSLPLSKFYTAIIVCALQSMHSNGFVYRDLKPENIMVQADGYLKIIDMGTCKSLKTSNANKTYTIIGTPNYMAPEILSGNGYSYSVDLWSLGIILFQFLSGFLPFGEHCQDPYQIYQEILKNNVKFPKYMKDSSANSLIMKLLNKNSEARLGQSYSQLKNHEFFSEVDWSQLIERKVSPSFKPPKDYLIKTDLLLKNLKPLDFYLKNPPLQLSLKNLKRADLNPKWDSCF